MSNIKLVLLAIVLCCIGISVVQACEGGCRSDPVNSLVLRYTKILEDTTKKIKTEKTRLAAQALVPKVAKKLKTPVDKAIFTVFRGSCAKPGKRHPDELCGSALSIACHARWDHKDISWLVKVNQEVFKQVESGFAKLNNKEVNDTVISGVKNYCPHNCQSWVKEYETMMLHWEEVEHPDAYKVIKPTCKVPKAL
ncbi:hypothetical protein B0O80DRAFT_531104 [Mortierella sp. GBAus27b]|nr:hypothetical protein BGX31_004159 [Mortierella sp. GBA43]KAI8350755.1 hypothetical protein B0O80DRAFT_531104 [Mortierella sp. GBAus27b]